MSRDIETKEDIAPLCIIVCRPKTKGWLLTDVIAVAVAALMWANTTLLAVFAQILRKLES